jgi:outer membrane immunogenic protein
LWANIHDNNTLKHSLFRHTRSCVEPVPLDASFARRGDATQRGQRIAPKQSSWGLTARDKSFATRQERDDDMKRVSVATTAICLLAGSALSAAAADLRRPPPPRAQIAAPVLAPLFDWSGFYVGINGGWSWGRSSYDFVGSGLGSTGDFRTTGGLIGGTLGYNYQVGQAVLGLEADLGWSGARGSALCPGGGAICETHNRWLGTVRGRVGYAMDRFMPYITGGLAYGNLRANIPGVGASTATKAGWTLGAGVEYAVNRNWSLKAEYLYVDLGKFDCGPACGAVPPTNVKFNTNILRAGLNYRF